MLADRANTQVKDSPPPKKEQGSDIIASMLLDLDGMIGP